MITERGEVARKGCSKGKGEAQRRVSTGGRGMHDKRSTSLCLGVNQIEEGV